ncbi:MAG: MucR family transcriptional regulator [Syntrophales bacterium]|jgi:predicted transcriptional regulator|nr:MucR family transcriptional regulator [Syntrophales bacterium]MCK9528636.1 MucR family transcriptional regulator [Syntrophales bacterium]MDX9923077.1 MucR family transcriptional regulator [Syntrophales bacterium]
MATNLLELTTDIVVAHASTTELSPEELLQEIMMVYATLQALERDDVVEEPEAPPKKRGRKPKKDSEQAMEPATEEAVQTMPVVEPAAPVISDEPVLSFEEAFQEDTIGCMICGRTGLKTLKKHLAVEHDMKPGQYKRKFKIPKDVNLVAPSYAAARRQMAIDRGLPEKLAAARAAKKKAE